MKVVELRDVWEKYRIKFIQKKKVFWEEFWALEDIKFTVNKGQVIGVIGKNGAGKTTLLKLIAGMLVPDRGEVDVQGKVSALMELGAGFNPEFTGRENVIFNARMYGLAEEVLERQMGGIIEFAGLGRFIDAPIKYYSQGMYMRLAFALAIYVEPDILLIDDILAVGDQEAQQKCIKKIFQLKQAGKTIVVVSHDMNMIGRLCDQVILLEKGKIVQKGSPQEIIPRYLEHVRNKFLIKQQEELTRLRESRSITSGSLRLFADLETKGLRLYYKDKEITKSSGLHISFLFNQTWHGNSSCDWQVDKEKDALILNLTWKQPQFSSTWKFSFKDNCFLWQVDFKSLERIDLDLLKFGLLVIPEYKSFFAAHQQGNFPNQFIQWQDMALEETQAELFGLRKETQLPAIVLENSQGLSCFIQNSDAQSSCRTLQLSFQKQELKEKSRFSFFTKISLLEDESLIENYLKQQKQNYLIKQQEKLICLRESRSITSGSLRLFADLETKGLRLYYKDKEITKGLGLHTLMNSGERWIVSSDARWQIEKISPKKLILILDYETLPLVQIWVLTCKEDNALEIEMTMEVNKQISLINRDVRLEISNGYKDWTTAYEKGDFFVKQYINNIGPINTLKDNRISNILLKSGVKTELPFLLFESISHLEKHIFTIYKRREEENEYICLHSSPLFFKKERVIKPGEYDYFKGKIILDDKEVKLKEPPFKEPPFIRLNKHKLRFIFDRGKGRIFWEDRELTTGLSLYTSVRSSGIWYDSYQAVWQIIEIKENKMLLTGDWLYIPISQTWQLELIEKNLIHWKVEMEIYEELNLEIEQANLMLLSEYKTWIIPGVGKGEFLDEYTQDYDIFPFRFWYGRVPEGGIGIVNRNLPCVFFKCNLENNCYRALIENADSLYQARLLQYQKSNTDKILPKKYTYFEGIIIIEPKG